MNLTKSNVVLAVLAAALAVPTWLQLQQDRATFVDVGRVPLLFDGFTAENVGRITLRVPKAEQPPAEADGQPPKVAYDDLVFVRNAESWAFGAGDLRFAPVLKSASKPRSCSTCARSASTARRWWSRTRRPSNWLATASTTRKRWSSKRATPRGRASWPTCWSATTPARARRAPTPCAACSCARATAAT